uniref:Sodium-dependent phosphate transport protein 2B-like n=1 Tax=Phallusia mammillata TaxID=59560 RepID=A0A6F9DSX1_9ASCI|nr:sodium-dependent phosphate transport protein 2B-like [Phallusia mammillata]
MTPLVGIGVISLKRMYPLTLGANIGTTTTSLFAALATDGEALSRTLQIAFSHFFFNIFGIAIWYVIPFMRNIPAVILGLSIAHIWAMGAVLILVGIIVLFVVVVKVLQAYRPQSLPVILQNWKFLPIFMRSLDPYDKVFTICCARCDQCRRCCGSHSENQSEGEVYENSVVVPNKVLPTQEVHTSHF